jgi:hypothetical protein
MGGVQNHGYLNSLEQILSQQTGGVGTVNPINSEDLQRNLNQSMGGQNNMQK